MYKLIVFVPIDAADRVKKALFDAGAGHIGLYEECCFEIRGYGQFKPTRHTHPHIGNVDQLTRLEELRLELHCPKTCLDAVIIALKYTHPYETPVYEVIKLESY